MKRLFLLWTFCALTWSNPQKSAQQWLQQRDIALSDLEFLRRVHSGDQETVEQMWLAGISLSVRDRESRTPLILAIAGEHQNLVALLLDAGANPNASMQNGFTPLMLACWMQQKETAAMLILAGAEVNASDNSRTTPLMYAVLSESPKLVQALIVAGAFVDARDKNKTTALMMAARMGNLAILKTLLRAEATKDFQNKDGMSAIMMASLNQHYAITKTLLKASASVRLQTPQGYNAMHLVCEINACQMVELLQSAELQKPDECCMKAKSKPKAQRRMVPSWLMRSMPNPPPTPEFDEVPRMRIHLNGIEFMP